MIPPKRCFVCNKVGHIAKNCFHRAKTGALTVQKRMQDRPNNQSSGKEKAYVCRPHGVQYCTECFVPVTPPQHTCNALLAPSVELKCGCTLPLLAEACNTDEGKHTRMPVTVGKLNGTEVNVLRDTGCSKVHSTQN